MTFKFVPKSFLNEQNETNKNDLWKQKSEQRGQKTCLELPLLVFEDAAC